ncbi:MAG: hypothetical protein HW402_975 [Dehalococcoidales bacterium]|nr:hypothetical protein [Dehalococcoidales bacterium]
MATDPFKTLRETPYSRFVAPKAYSFDLNEKMIKLLHEEFAPALIAGKLARAISGKKNSQVEKIGQELFEDYGQRWMKRTMQLGEEYPDRTIEIVMETVDHQGNQFLFFPHVPQRFIEIAYLTTQSFLRLPIIVNNQHDLVYQVPKCLLFSQIKEQCGHEVANLMTCRHACLKALETLHQDLKLDAIVKMTASTAKDGHCEFSMKKV